MKTSTDKTSEGFAVNEIIQQEQTDRQKWDYYPTDEGIWMAYDYEWGRLSTLIHFYIFLYDNYVTVFEQTSSEVMATECHNGAEWCREQVKRYVAERDFWWRANLAHDGFPF